MNDTLFTQMKGLGKCVGVRREESQLFDYLIRNLSLSRTNLNVREKNFISCLRIDNTTNQLLVSGDNMGRIRLFDLSVLDKCQRDRSEMFVSNTADQQKCHTKLISSLSWFPSDNGMFISGSMDQSVNIWDVERFSIASHIRYSQPVTDVEMPTALSFSHKMVAVCCGSNGVSLIDLFSGSTIQEILGAPTRTTCCCWNPKKEYQLMVGDDNGGCTLFDIRKAAGETVLQSIPPMFEVSVSSCLYSSDGERFFVTAAEPNPVRMLDGVTLTDIPVSFSSLSPWKKVSLKPCLGGRYLVYPDGANCVVRIIDTESGCCVNTLHGHMDAVTCCCFRENVYEVYSGGRDGFILRYDAMRVNDSDLHRFQGVEVE
ncbi:hypothetical protein WA588_000434, partial [Blastocystis sp. NMH]